MFEVNVVDLRLDVFRFVAKKQASQKGSLFRLIFEMRILYAKQGNFNLKRVLLNSITKWLCYIYRQPECHFKLCYCYKLVNFNQVRPLASASFLSSLFIIHGIVKLSKWQSRACPAIEVSCGTRDNRCCIYFTCTLQITVRYILINLC